MQVAGGHETVLAVEDDTALRRVTVRGLGHLGYHALEADNAAAALKLLAEKKVDLLFTDVVMPGDVNGLELARIALARWPALKVVLTSGFVGDGLAGEAGDLRLLAKPYGMADLARILREALDGSVAKRG